MLFRLATKEDLNDIKSVYLRIMEDIKDINLCMWDEDYPISCFDEDINNKSLHILTDGKTIAGAVAICECGECDEKMRWKEIGAKALYLFRLGVNVNYKGKGIGNILVQEAMKSIKKRGVEYLRLFVVIDNLPAIKLYERNGFRRVEGIFEELIDENKVLREYGYEIEIN